MSISCDVRSFSRSATAFALATAFTIGLAGTGARAAIPDATVAAAPAPALPDDIRASATAGNTAPLAEYVAAHPSDRAAAILLGDLYIRNNDSARAEAVFAKLAAASPGDREVHDRLGNIFAIEDRVDDAIAEFERALPDVAAYGDLVRLHKRRGDLAAYVATLRRAADQGPLDAAAQFGYGVVLRELHHPKDALSYLTAALQNSPRSCATLTEIGSVDLDLGQTAAASSEFRECLSLEPNDYSALVDLSDTYSTEQAADARALLERAEALKPTRPEAIVDLGYIEDSTGNVDGAIARYDRALELDPFFRDAYVDLGFAYVEKGRYQLADVTLERGLSVSRDDGRIAYILGKSFERQGKRDLAAREYRIARMSDEPEIAAAATKDLASVE